MPILGYHCSKQEVFKLLVLYTFFYKMIIEVVNPNPIKSQVVTLISLTINYIQIGY